MALEQKNRMVLTMIIAVVIVIAVLSSFGLPFLQNNTPEIQLPDLNALETPRVTLEPGQPGGEDGYIPVAVTPDTVQEIIATLARPTSYYREITLETIWGEGEDQRTTQTFRVWVDGGYTRVESVLPSGLTQTYILGEDTLYLWYGNSSRWEQWSGIEVNSDLVQHLPTYEDILGLDREDIVGTGYEEKEGIACIYIEVKTGLQGYLQRYWVSTESGLLVADELVKGETVVLRSFSYQVESPAPQGTSFALPDGTVLYTPDG